MYIGSFTVDYFVSLMQNWHTIKNFNILILERKNLLTAVILIRKRCPALLNHWSKSPLKLVTLSIFLRYAQKMTEKVEKSDCQKDFFLLQTNFCLKLQMNHTGINSIQLKTSFIFIFPHKHEYIYKGRFGLLILSHCFERENFLFIYNRHSPLE